MACNCIIPRANCSCYQQFFYSTPRDLTDFTVRPPDPLPVNEVLLSMRKEFERLRDDLIKYKAGYEGAAEAAFMLNGKVERLQDALRWAAPYVKDDPRVSKIVEAALKEKE